MFVFRKIWLALFSWNTGFEIRPFALLLTIWQWVSLSHQTKTWEMQNDVMLKMGSLTRGISLEKVDQVIGLKSLQSRHGPIKESCIKNILKSNICFSPLITCCSNTRLKMEKHWPEKDWSEREDISNRYIVISFFIYKSSKTNIFKINFSGIDNRMKWRWF